MRVLGLLFGVVLAGAAAAQECSDRDTILTLADRILAGRAELSRFQVRNYGTEAVYLKLMYGALTRDEALAALTALAAEKVRSADDAAAALAVTDKGIEAGLALLDPDPARALLMGNTGTIRAVILADDGVTYFRLIADARQRLDKALAGSRVPGLPIAVILSDQPDDVRARIAANAEAAGEVPAAGLLFADMETLDAYEAFRQRHAANAETIDFLSSPGLEALGSSLRIRDAPVPYDSRPDFVGFHIQIYTILKAAYLEGQSDYLNTLVNQSGDLAAGVAAARVLQGAVAADLDPARDPEAAWAAVAHGLTTAMPAERIVQLLGYYDWPGVRLRHYSGTAGESLSVILARQALVPFLRDGAPQPEPPPLLIAGFDWDGWLRVASALAAGEVPAPASPAERIALIELLDGLGRTAEAADLAGTNEEAMPVWRDLIQRADRRCEAYSAHPGEALWLGGEILWKF